jgi:histidinol phosphatase-like PHP family hydrolase
MSETSPADAQGGRIDFHTHSLLSDGVLLPSELLRRAEILDFEAVAITDHADASNLEMIIDSLRRVLVEQATDFRTRLLVGVELTHVHPARIDRLARRAKALGAEVVVVHGETIVEPVAPGTNRAAIDSPAVDVLAHPGFITLDEARDAAERGCFIEITTRPGHSYTNGHVARVCREAGARMVVDSDSHEPADLPTMAFARRVAAGAGLTEAEVQLATATNPALLLSRVLSVRAI